MPSQKGGYISHSKKRRSIQKMKNRRTHTRTGRSRSTRMTIKNISIRSQPTLYF